MIETWFVSIGVEYTRDNPHPNISGMTSDDWIEVVLPSEAPEKSDLVRQVAFAVLGDKWAFHYSPDGFERRLWPGRCRCRITFLANNMAGSLIFAEVLA